MSQSPSGRQDDGSKRDMLNFPNSLDVCMMSYVLMFLKVEDNEEEQLERARELKTWTSIKHLSDRPPQKPFAAMSKRAPL